MNSEIEITGNTLRIVRTLDAPRARVFRMWSQADKLQQWSGCRETTHCEVEMDFRVGGGFTQKMQISGAGEFVLRGAYIEIVEPERIVYQVKFGPALTTIRVEFFEDGQRTRLVLTHQGLPDEFLCKTISQGTNESLEKLAAQLASQTASSLV